jgi:hypothetical protein
MNANRRYSEFKWAAWVDDFETIEVESRMEHIFETKVELNAFLVELEQRKAGRLDVFKLFRKTRLPWWERMLLLGEFRLQTLPCFFLYWADECATLMFHDEHSSEYHAYDHQHYVENASVDLRARLNFGELAPIPQEECLRKSKAFQACRDFIDTGGMPESLSY